MTRETFLDSLQNALRWQCSPDEAREIVHDYEEFFSEGLTAGRSEEDLGRELGEPAAMGALQAAWMLCAVLGVAALLRALWRSAYWFPAVCHALGACGVLQALMNLLQMMDSPDRMVQRLRLLPLPWLAGLAAAAVSAAVLRRREES